jgi:hypothetical protein
MRIPPSVIVMSVVTAVPFGLGVRDTLKNKDVTADEYGDLDFGDRRSARERARALEEYEAEERREALDREEKSRARVAQLDQLIGDRPAQMGTLFDGITLGAGAGSFQPENVRLRIESASRDGFLSVVFDADTKALNAVSTTIYSDYDTSDVCEKLEDKLGQKWGRATNNAWLDAAAHQRATLDKESCQLRFERFVSPTDWVAALPLNAIGMSADKYAAQLQAGDVEQEDDRMYWTTPGLGYGKGVSRYEAFLVNDKIVGVQVTADSDFDSILAVRDAISAKLKAQPKKTSDDYDTQHSTLEWKRRVPVTLDTTGTDKFTVTVGKIPWD